MSQADVIYNFSVFHDVGGFTAFGLNLPCCMPAVEIRPDRILLPINLPGGQ
jgi:hypothetical protein